MKDIIINFDGEDTVLVIERYAMNNRPCFTLYTKDTGEPFIVITVNIPEAKLAFNEMFIKEFSGNENVVAVLKMHGLLTGKSIQSWRSGFVLIFSYELTDKALDLIAEAK